jgi:D-aspartate ligase
MTWNTRSTMSASRPFAPPGAVEVDRSTPVVLIRPSIGVMRSLGRLGVPVFCVDATGRAAATTSRYCSGVAWWDSYTAEPDESVEFFTRLARTVGNRPILLAADDHGALFVARHGAALARSYRLQHPEPDVAHALSNKRDMFELCRQLGFPTPDAVFPQRRNDREAAAADLQFPLVVKGIDTELQERRTGLRMAIAHDRAELLAHYEHLESRAAPNLMVQEYIPGGAESTWMFNGYFDHESRCLFGCTGRKLRQWPDRAGATTLCSSTRNPEVERMVMELMQAVRYRGPVDLGVRHDRRDGRYKLLDVNPRIGATFRLFVGDTGLDVARVMHLDLTGRPVPAAAHCGGRKWIDEYADLRSAYQFMREGQLAPARWLQSLRGIDECQWLARDDPIPFARMGLSLASAAVRRRAHKLGMV